MIKIGIFALGLFYSHSCYHMSIVLLIMQRAQPYFADQNLSFG